MTTPTLAVSKFPAPPIDWLEYLARQVADQQLHTVVVFDGHINAERMLRAVRLTLDAQPVLGCRFVPAKRHPYWEQRRDLNDLALCEVVRTDDVEHSLWNWITAPLNPGADPVIQTRVFRSTHDTLCIKVDHVAADAGGTKEYVALLADTYRELGANPRYVPAPRMHGDRGLGQVFRHVSPRILLDAWPHRHLPTPQWGFPTSRASLDDRAFVTHQIGPERFRAIKRCVQSHAASVNDILLAAEFRALGTLIQPPRDTPLTMQVSIDLRRYIPSGRGGAIANLAGALFPTLTWAPEAPFEQTLLQARDAMNALKAHGPGLGSALYLQLGASVLGFTRLEAMVRGGMAEDAESGKSHPFLSNLGLLDEIAVHFGEKVSDAYLVGPVLFPPGLMLCASSFRERMRLTCGFCNARSNRPIYEQLLDLVLRELTA